MSNTQWEQYNYLMIKVQCWVCGIPFMMPQDKDYRARTKGDGHGFYCPSGHLLGRGEGDEAKLQKELNEANARAQRYTDSFKAAQKIIDRLEKKLERIEQRFKKNGRKT